MQKHDYMKTYLDKSSLEKFLLDLEKWEGAEISLSKSIHEDGFPIFQLAFANAKSIETYVFPLHINYFTFWDKP